ncbi:AAA family ATPase [Dyadobacter sp. LHD-138]|uniref:AAA family ATPase n=1 Tax=Dyadobacter sp. LHD-138 TaxID=3071413 RepID=UPI0027DF5E06|nr:AAA family ATPase [Dyadobacter sp. LHD-138]MDQ6481834.1 AAA family ATPase [Dyadobacter sp. LHD-138]
MKFKKIEISAFRIYDDPKNATFDFSIAHDDTARFVSIYAPNGYGKTSFYDAVEWGMTNNIQRFWQNEPITNGSINALKDLSNHQIKLWRNTSSILPTYVKITTDKATQFDRELKPHGNRKADAVNSLNIENRTFRSVILSQEWISAFLREVDGTRRYEIFMENPELSELDTYYKNLKSLLTVCDDRIENLEGKISEEEERTSDLETENVLDSINNQLDLLSEQFKQPGLEKITFNSSREDISKLKNLVVDRLISLSKEKEITEKLKLVTIAKVGNAETVSLKSYFELLNKHGEVEAEIDRLSKINVKFENREKKSTELINLNEMLLELDKQQDLASSALRQFAEYERIGNLLSDKRNSSNDFTTGKQLNDERLSIVERHEEATINNLDDILSSIVKTSEKISELPGRALEMSKLTGQISELSKLLGEQREKVSPLMSQMEIIRNNISKIELILDKIDLAANLADMIEDKTLLNNIKSISTSRAKIEEKLVSLAQLNLSIEEQESLNSELLEFIKRGLDLLNRNRESNTCPLCEQQFTSHEQLAQRIANNQALGKALQHLLVEKNKFETDIADLEKIIKSENQIVSDYFKGLIDKNKIAEVETSEGLRLLNETILTLVRQLEFLEKRQREFFVEQKGMTNSQYEAELRATLVALENNKKTLSEDLTATNERKAILQMQSKQLAGNLEALVQDLASLSKSEQYLSVIQWFQANLPSSEVTRLSVETELNRLSGLATENANKIAALRLDLETLSADLAPYVKGNLLENLNNIKSERDNVRQKTNAYENFLKDKLELDITYLEQEILSKALELKEAGFALELKANSDLINEYSKVERYGANISEFLQSEIAKTNLIKFKEELVFLAGEVCQLLKNEVNNAKYFLEAKVKEFFYEELINDLYRKIDPHPDFKEVHIKADFDSEAPRLDVFVKNTRDEEILIPNLYFSTAQVNILSLSIFLASALNASNYDCIFIDDPIQSMDSVNILSTIDLLRSIILNYDKQIILSTHDENFFNLLQKKMPPGQFRSKFLQLESVGRVKNSVS